MSYNENIASLAIMIRHKNAMGNKVKIVKVNYGLANKPHTRNIEKTISRWTGKGYELHGRQEQSPFMRRGHTDLTFIKKEPVKAKRTPRSPRRPSKEADMQSPPEWSQAPVGDSVSRTRINLKNTCLIPSAAVALLIVFLSLGRTIGIIPDSSATQTARAADRATPVANVAHSPSPTTLVSSPTGISKNTPTAAGAATQIAQTVQAFEAIQTRSVQVQETETVPELTVSETPRPILTSTPVFTTVPETEVWYVTNAQKVNIRSCAGTGCEVLAILSYADPVTVVPPFSTDWQEVLISAGQTGFINPYYLSRTIPPRASPTIPQPTALPQFEETRYATAVVNIRSCAGTTCQKVGSLVYGDSFIATGKGTDADGKTWYSFAYGGQTVWVAGWLTSTTRPALQPTQAPVIQQPSVEQPQQPPVAPAWNCSGNIYNCDSFSSCQDMFSYFYACPGDPSDLDHDGDGRPCETQCG